MNNSMSKNKILLIILLVIVVGFVVYYILINNKNSYYDPDSGLSFSLPENWSELSKEDVFTYNPDAKLGFIKTSSGDTSLGIRIDDAEGKENFKTEESLEVLKKNYQENIDDFVVISEDIVEIFDIPAINLTYSYSVPTDDKGNSFRGTQRQVMFLYGGKFYRLMLNTLPDDFEADNKDFQKILDTFEIKN